MIMSPLRSLVLVSFAGSALAAMSIANAGPALMPGSVGLTQKEVPLRNACTKTFAQIKKVKRGDDPAYVAALTYPRITGLDFDPAKKGRSEASRKKFDAWFQKLMKTTEAATKVQRKVFDDTAATPAAKIEAAARMSILLDQMALIIESSEVPRNIRSTQETVDIYCDTLAEKTEPLRAQAKEARAVCAKAASDAKLGDAWWVSVCSPTETTP
jgi:hypothetical protein